MNSAVTITAHMAHWFTLLQKAAGQPYDEKAWQELVTTVTRMLEQEDKRGQE